MRSKYFSVVTDKGPQVINADHVVTVKEVNGKAEISMSNGELIETTLSLSSVWSLLEQAFEVSLRQ